MKRIITSIAAVLTLVASMLPSVLVRAADAGPLASVAISPAPALVAVNGTQQFTAASKDAANQTVSNATYTWSVVAGGGTINATSGLFTAGNATGTFNSTVVVVAVQGNITVSAAATVNVAVPGELVTLAVSPASAFLASNTTQQFTAVAKDAFNQNATSVNYTWAVVAGGGAVDNATGLFTAGNASGTFNGTVQVTAVQGNITQTANATVIVAIPGQLITLAVSPAAVTLPVNGTQQFTAVAKDAFNQNATGVNLTWSVVTGGGTINSTSGLFTAGNTTGTFNGTVQVSAVQGNITRTAAATVTLGIHGALDHVVISPANATVAVNGTRQFTAVAKDIFNNNVSNVTYNWSVVAGGGTINATSGLFTAGNTTGTFNGTVQVTAVQGSVTRTANATVTVGIQGILDHVVISPANTTVAVNGTRQFRAVAKDIFNNNVSNVTYNWSVAAAGGTINATSGLFTAGNTTGTFNGTVQVTAVQGNITRTANATVAVVAKTAKKPGTPPGWEHGKKKGWDGKDTPPGYDHGKKKGWDDDNNPPGFVKHDDDEDEDENEAQPANHGTDKGNSGDADHGNSGNTPAAGIANTHGKMGED